MQGSVERKQKIHRETNLIEHNGLKESLAGRVIKGSAWLFSSYALSGLGRMVMMLIIAALLSPREYGIIGLCGIIVVVTQIINEFGIWQAVVHHREPDERFINTAFTANVFGALLTTGALFLAAPWVAGFYGEPVMTTMLRVMGLAFVLDAVFYVPDGLLRKELRFKSRALPEVAATFGAVVTTVVLLLLGAGVLSYAIGLVVDSAIRCVLTFLQISWRPTLQVSWPYLREIIWYGKHIMGTNLALSISSNVDNLLVGRILGAGPLGFYTLAFNLANYPVNNFVEITKRILFPTFATLQGNPDYAKRVYLKVVRIEVALVAPALVTLAFLAYPLVVSLLGEKWQPAVFPLQLMIVAGISRTISFLSADMLRAFGFPDLTFKINICEALVVLGALLLVAPRGIDAVAATVAVVLSLFAWMTVVTSCRVFGIKLREMGLALAPGIALSASGAGAILGLGFLGLSFLPDGLYLPVAVTAVGAAMFTCLVTVCRSFLRETVALATSRKQMRKMV